MSNIYIAGIAMTVFGRHLERSLADLAGEALQGALKDANCQLEDLGIAYYAGMTNGPLQGQISIPGHESATPRRRSPCWPSSACTASQSSTSKMPVPQAVRRSIERCKA